ncbi:hypothetical protein J813_2481 [Acinetobacter sp. 25977_10]|nr:hypothetical protein J813_2481 [Acinetobacter sp. 25977_10]
MARVTAQAAFTRVNMVAICLVKETERTKQLMDSQSSRLRSRE